MTPPNVHNFVDLLAQRLSARGDEPVFTWYDGESTTVLSYAMLCNQAQLLASRILSIINPGDRAVLLFAPGLDYVVAFFACLYAGVIAVPAYPPRGPRGMQRLKTIIEDSGAALALTATAPDRKALAPETWQNLKVLSIHDVESEGQRQHKPQRLPQLNGASVALLQYTSGSTDTPKGVIVSHSNLLANCELIHERFGNSSSTRGLIWLPPYHDMGLIGGLLQPIFSCIRVTLMSPLPIVQQPLRWLKAISTFGATVSGAPNFAYELCVRKIAPQERAQLDLRSWEVAFTGAEPIRRETIRRFTEAFAPSGFDPKAIFPCYGLAESTLLATGGVHDRSLRVSLFDEGNTIDDEANETLVACGEAGIGHEVVIVDPVSQMPCSEGRDGEIWLTGPSVAQGYWGKPDLTRDVFAARLADGRGPYLRTGDLGRLRDHILYVNGRIKDLIIIRGRNYYPQDLEATVERCHKAIRFPGVAAFSIDAEGEEQLVVVAEVHPRAKAESDAIIAAVRSAVAAEYEILAHAVLLVTPGAVPKTSSGKIQRFECRRSFLEGTFEKLLVAVSFSSPDGISNAPSADSLRFMEETDRISALENYLLQFVSNRIGTAGKELNPDSDLVGLGLDSLGMVSLGHLCESSWNVTLSLPDLLRPQTTLRSVAAQIAKRIDEQLPVTSAEADPALGMSEGQRALWLMDRAREGQAGLMLARAVTIRGELDADALRRSLGSLVARHVSLRLCFPDHEGVPFAVDRGETSDWFRQSNAREWDEPTVQQFLKQEALRPFELSTGPLFRVTLWARKTNEWILLIQAHHIVMDFESFAILLNELEAVYRSQVDGDRRTLDTIGASYAAFVAAECAQLESESAVGPRAIDHWRSMIGAGLTALKLPEFGPKQLQTNAGGGRVFFAVPTATVSNLHALARQERVTFYVLLVAAWAFVLHRLSGQSDIVLGCPASLRPSERFSRTVGHLVNLLALRFRFDDDPSFATLLARTQKQWVAALEHCRYPFSRILNELRLERTGPLQPLFQSLVSLNSVLGSVSSVSGPWSLGSGSDRFEFCGLSMESIELPIGSPQVELALSLVEVDGAISGSLEFNASRFSPATADSVATRFVLLLKHLGGLLKLTTSRITLLGTDEAQAMLALGDGISRAQRHVSINEWWSEAAVEHSDRIAIEYPGGALTFHELDLTAGRVAALLQQKGIEREEPVGIYAERAPETVIAMLGILKAGAMFVPLDSGQPRERLQRMVNDAGLKRILARSTASPHVLEVAEWQQVDLTDTQSETASPVPVTARSAAYAIFTSGSTGVPKAVVVEHLGLCNLVESQIEAFGITPASKVLQYASFGFDASVSEVFVTLLAGATLQLSAVNDLLVGEVLASALARGATCVTLPPSVLSLLDANTFPQLETVVSAGESCSDALVNRWAPGRRFINAYGPTEATVCATLANCYKDTPGSVIGRPIANTRTYVLDANQAPAAPGVTGELFIGGAGVARGYLGQPDLTAERFLPDPFAVVPGMRMYRTSDLVRWRSDGSLDFVGRSDRQVKIRGFRLELAEVEFALLSNTALAECVTVAKRSDTGETRLLAYVVAKPGIAMPSAAELRAHLRRLIPEAMVPGAFVPLPALPRGANGKIDIAALPDPPPIAAGVPFLATNLEQLVANVWREVIQIEQTHPNDNFFDIGGNSLSAAQVHVRLEEKLGRQFPLLDLFTYPTVRSLARSFERTSHEKLSVTETNDAASRARQTTARLRQLKRAAKTS